MYEEKKVDKINLPEGEVMVDGLIHGKDGKMYFQDGILVKGANTDYWISLNDLHIMLTCYAKILKIFKIDYK